AGIDVEREYRRQIQVVAAAGAPDPLVPRRAVTGADVEQPRVRVVRERIPGRAAAAHRPPLAVPSPRRRLERRVLERLLRVSGNRIETPHELAGLRVVRRDEAAHAELGAAVADHDLAVDDARRAGDRVRLVDRRRLHVPDRLPGLRVERDEAAVDDAHEDLAVVEREDRKSTRLNSSHAKISYAVCAL